MYDRLNRDVFDDTGSRRRRGRPFALLIGNYDFTAQAEDVELLSRLSSIAAKSFCPFMAAASPRIFGLDSYDGLASVSDLKSIFDTLSCKKWNDFRNSIDSRYITLALPHVLARSPYGKSSCPASEFAYEESESPNECCWMNPVFVLGTKITAEFEKYGSYVGLRSADDHGILASLPKMTCRDRNQSIEIRLADHMKSVIQSLGFSVICEHEDVLRFDAVTTNRPRKHEEPEATRDRWLVARLDYLLTEARFMHHMMRFAHEAAYSNELEEVGHSFMKWLHEGYVMSHPKSQAEKRRNPLKEAMVRIEKRKERSGIIVIISFLQPHLLHDKLCVAQRQVAEVRLDPKRALKGAVTETTDI
jgi:type VI secretion system protein ImpC